MPTPYGSRGAMAFSADELRVLRRALAIALQPSPLPLGADREMEVQELFRLAEAVEEAVREGGRLRAFLLDDLARYRAALPGAALGYLERLKDVLSAGYAPAAADLAALRSLCAARPGASNGAKAGAETNTEPGAETERRRVLLRRCEALAEQALRNRLAREAAAVAPARAPGERPALPPAETLTRTRARGSGAPRRAQAPALPPGTRLVALPGGLASEEPAKPSDKPSGKPAARPKGEPQPGPEPSPGERPARPVPTPAEVFPPRRRRTAEPPPPPPSRPEQLAAV